MVSVLNSMYRLGSLLVVVLGFLGGAEFDHQIVYCTLRLCTVLVPPRNQTFPDLFYNKKPISSSNFISNLLFLLIFRNWECLLSRPYSRFGSWLWWWLDGRCCWHWFQVWYTFLGLVILEFELDKTWSIQLYNTWAISVAVVSWGSVSEVPASVDAFSLSSCMGCGKDWV